MLIFYTPLGLGTALKTRTDLSQSIPIDKVVSITTSQELPGITSMEDIFRIEWTPSKTVYRVRLAINQEVQIDVSTGEVLSKKPDNTGLLIYYTMDTFLVIGIDTVL
ncbi:hypothetical protein [Peribacillus sp. NPDC096448]|uniref:hypothetical protein n=1 Tax=Peribacillus sp. NPDC096448 TaxID=3364395 RepID=UPI0037FF5299